MRGQAALICAAAAIWAGCKRAPAAPDAARVASVPDAGPTRELIRIQQISVEAAAWPEAAGPPPEERILAGRIWEGLSPSGDFEALGRRGLPDSGPGTLRRRARLRTVYGVEELGPAIRGVATLTIEWADDLEGPELWSSVACEGEAPKDRRRLGDVAGALVECAVTRGATDLVAKQQIRRGDLPVVLKALDDPDPSVRQVAFGAIAERHLVEAMPHLVRLLQSKEELVRDGAIGALVALRDRRAIKPLTDLAAFKDLDLMRRIIDAVGSIGGDDAHAYLELVASGHDVPIIRELAQQALDRMNRRSDGGT